MYFSVQTIRPIETVIRAPEVSEADFVGRSATQSKAPEKKAAPRAKNVKGRTFGRRNAR